MPFAQEFSDSIISYAKTAAATTMHKYDNTSGSGWDFEPSLEHRIADDDIRFTFLRRRVHLGSVLEANAIIVVVIANFQPPIAAVLSCGLGMIHKACDAGGLGTVCTAKHHVIALHPMTENPAATMLTSRCQRVDGAFEGIEIIALILHCYAKGIFIRITAGITGTHVILRPS